MSSKPNTWKEFFSSFAVKLEGKNKNTRLLIDMSIPETNQVKAISNFVQDKVAIICYYSTLTKSVNFIHHATDLGGGLLLPESKVVAFDGFRESAFPVQIINESISNTNDQQVPNLDALKQIESIEDVKGLTMEDVDNELYSGHPFMVLPPFLWEAALNLPSKEPAAVLLNFMNTLSDFSANHEDSEFLSKENLQKSCKRLFQFLWLAEKDEATSLILLPPSDDQEIIDWSNFKHSQCLAKKQSEIQPNIIPDRRVSFQQPSVNEELLRNSIEQISRLAPESKKKGFEKLQESTKTLILNASSTDGMSKPNEPTDECKTFFSQSGSAEAKTVLAKSLEFKWGCIVKITSGLVLSLYTGHFTRSYSALPQNFSPFSFPKRSFKDDENEKETLKLSLREISGEGLNDSDIEGAVEQDIVVPHQIELMRYNIKNLIGAACFFFGHNSLLPQRLDQISQHVKRNMWIYESLQYSNRYFATQFLFAIDNKVNVWLQDCELVSCREDVNDSLIDFSDELNKVVMHQFHIHLPKSLKDKINDPAKSSDKGDNSSSRKRKSSESSSKSSKIENEDTIDDWKISQDEYDRFFRHNNKQLEKRPTLNGDPMCHRWHSKGYCFSDCNNKNSHVPSSAVCKEIKKEYSNWKNSMMNK